MFEGLLSLAATVAVEVLEYGASMSSSTASMLSTVHGVLADEEEGLAGTGSSALPPPHSFAHGVERAKDTVTRHFCAATHLFTSSMSGHTAASGSGKVSFCFFSISLHSSASHKKML